MRREDFEHVIRAAADVVDDEIVVIGSQAVLAADPDVSVVLLRSQELDVFPLHDPARAAEIDRAIGDGSPFHATYGYYAHGVGPETAHAPDGWEARLVRVDVPKRAGATGTATAWCLEVHDLVLAKLAAGRSHDLTFVDEALRTKLVHVDELIARVARMPDRCRDETAGRLRASITRVTRPG